MIFGIPVGKKERNLIKLKDKVRTFVSQGFQHWGLKYSWIELNCPSSIRVQRRQLEILGLLVFLLPSGKVSIAIPMNKWKQRLTYQKL